MKLKHFIPGCAALAACLLASGCGSSYSFMRIDDWDTWTGWNDAYGREELKNDGLYYYLTERQDDTRDTSSDGYSPGLIISKEILGATWRIDVEPYFKIPPGQVKRFSFGIWEGGDSARPSIASASGTLKIVVQRQNGPKPADDALLVFYLPGGKPFRLPVKAKALRFERKGNFFTFYYSLNRKKFEPVFRLDAGDTAASVPSQKFFIAGFAGGNPEGAYARFSSMKINGAEILR
jgi:hypothetical protein